MLDESNSLNPASTASQQVGRVVKLVLIVSTIIGSLITFPSGLSYMALAWIAASLACLATQRNRLAGITCLLFVLIMIVKTPGSSIALVALIIFTLASALICIFTKTKRFF